MGAKLSQPLPAGRGPWSLSRAGAYLLCFQELQGLAKCGPEGEITVLLHKHTGLSALGMPP